MVTYVGFFTMAYELIKSIFTKFPDILRLYGELPFLVQEFGLMFLCCFILPKLIDLIEKLKEYRLKFEDSL